MEQIPLVKQLRTSQIIIGSLSLLSFLFNFVGTIIFTSPSVSGFYFDLIYYFLFGLLGIFFILRRNWAVYGLFLLFIRDSVLMFIAGLYPLLIYDGIVIFLCIQFVVKYQKYLNDKENEVTDLTLKKE